MLIDVPEKHWPIYRKIARCSVRITTESGLTGTGVVISKDGLIITAFHVIRDAETIHVRRIILSHKRKRMSVRPTDYLADTVYTDAAADLAVIQVRDIKKRMWPAKIGDSDIDPNTGLYRLGFGDCPIGSGYLFCRGTYRNIEEIGISLPCQPGNSGGGIFDQYGRLIGIVLRSVSDNLLPSSCFAIPINLVRQRIRETGSEDLQHLLKKFLP